MKYLRVFLTFGFYLAEMAQVLATLETERMTVLRCSRFLAATFQHENPVGPALFSLGVDQIARSAVSVLNIWHLDDGSKLLSQSVLVVWAFVTRRISPCPISSLHSLGPLVETILSGSSFGMEDSAWGGSDRTRGKLMRYPEVLGHGRSKGSLGRSDVRGPRP